MVFDLVSLIVVLLISGFGIPYGDAVWTDILRFWSSMVLYGLVLVGIVVQGRYLKKRQIGNVILLLFLGVYTFVLRAPRAFLWLPEFLQWNVVVEVFSLALYFVGLWLSYYSVDQSRRKAWYGVRFLLPFTVPFLCLELLGEIFPWYVSLFFIFSVFIFIAPVLKFSWGCIPLKDSALKQRLDSLCLHAKFKHAGIQVWTVMNHYVSAAIIGVVPWFRYVIFTEALLKRINDDDIEAILAHEIGHSYHKHLLFYPFVVLGMTVSGGVLFSYFDLSYGFVGSVLFMLVYMRLVFGFFSRNFERQADLHVMKLGMPPRRMYDALNAVAIATGGIHRKPSWHHYSVQERMNFLLAVEQNHSLADKHHRKVFWMRAIYLAVLFGAVSLYAIL
jgi:Zn-dependent protease with chaperone function